MMSREKKNKIWLASKEELISLTLKAVRLADILRGLTTDCSSANYVVLKKRLSAEGIEYSHISLGKSSNKGKSFAQANKLPLSSVMIKNSSYSRSCLKRRLLKENLLENKCSECGLKDIWNGKPINMQIDHINGVADDHRLENLRMVCANCHSQTDTYAGKNTEKAIRVSSIDKMSRSERPEGGLIPSSRTDWRFRPRLNKRKVIRPSAEELYKLLWSLPTQQIAKQFGVSDKAIEKWAKIYKLAKPARGYWSKQKQL